jgi:SAM-dependent methyltransferase
MGGNTSVRRDAADDETQLLLRLRETPEIFQALAQQKGDALRVQAGLRKRFDAELVRAALSVHEARVRAADLLPRPADLWLTRTALEQSTAWEVAQHKSLRFPRGSKIFDLCCGIGVDATALTHRGPVTAVDISPAMCLRCEWNSETWHADRQLATECRDVSGTDWSEDLVHADPDRRAGRDRAVRRLEQYQPDLEWMQHLSTNAAGGALKLGPASNFLQKFHDCEIELISLNGECREATVWFGGLSTGQPFRATSLPSGEFLAGNPLSFRGLLAESVGKFLYDPDPAVVRAGLVDALCEERGLARLDLEEEYLTSEELVETALAVPFRVSTVLPNSMRQLRQRLRDRPSRFYEVKCRRIPIDAAAVQRSLPRGDGDPCTILFTRCGGKAHVVIAERVPRSGSAAVIE